MYMYKLSVDKHYDRCDFNRSMNYEQTDSLSILE
jgi:hypothetical protein